MFDDIAAMIDKQMKELEGIVGDDDIINTEDEDIKLEGMKEEIKDKLTEWYLSFDGKHIRFRLRSFIIGYLGSLRHVESNHDTVQKIRVRLMKVGK